MNLPNKLTILRIIFVLIIVIISLINIPGSIITIPIKMLIMLVLFIIASFTDTLDGYLARSRDEVTDFGKFLDPIADKILVIAVMIIFVQYGRLPAWIPIVVIFREFLVSGYRLIAVEKKGKVIAANIWGKIKTVTQMIALSLMFIDSNVYCAIINGNIAGWEFWLNLLTTVLMTVSVVATVFSGYQYLKGCKELFEQKGDN